MLGVQITPAGVSLWRVKMKNKYGLVLLAGAALSVGSFFVGKSRGYEHGLSFGKGMGIGRLCIGANK